jgi:hypothetical protein
MANYPGVFTPRETAMKITTIVLAVAFALSSSFALAYSGHRHHHHMRYHSASPNGTAGGATSLSGTGSSQFGGSVAGSTGRN